MRAVLPPELSFDTLQAQLTGLGWQRREIPGLLPPLRPGEPEQAQFRNGSRTMLYSLNPVVDFRVIEGDIDSRMPQVDAQTVRGWLDSSDPSAMARGCLAAAELQLDHLIDTVASVAAALPEPLKPMGQAALRRLQPLPDPRPAGPFDVLPAAMKRQVLRHALADHPASAADLVPRCWSDGPELAATAMIVCARLGLRDQGLSIKRADLAPLGRTRREQEVFVALKKACLVTLEGQRPGPEVTPRNTFWRAVLGEETGMDDVTLLLHALITPLPATAVDPPPEGFCTVADVVHWIGHDSGKGLANPLRTWRPGAPVTLMTGVSALVAGDAIDGTLNALSAMQPLRLPTALEWEAAMRGPDGRPYPWGVAPEMPALPMSPWGALWTGQPEWATQDETLVLCGSDTLGRVSFLRASQSRSRAAVRGVISAKT